jgi:ribose-phosphate pyrophosphokinase
MYGEIKIFGGRANPALTREICDYLNLPVGRSSAYNFSDGETFCKIEENVRGSDVFIVQPTCRPVNENLIELLIMLDAFKRSSASRVTAVMPYYGYARQDKKDAPRVPITAKLVADLISRAGADRVLTMDLTPRRSRASSTCRRSPIPLRRCCSTLRHGDPDIFIVADAGGVERARAIAKRLGVGLAIVDKRRTAPNVAEIMHVIGDVAGKNTLILDDIVDTAGTLTKTVDALKAHGALRILAAGVHGVLSGPELERIEKSPLELVLVTNTTPVEEHLPKSSKLRALSVAPLLGEAILRIHENSSVSSLFV